jgi:hypothetical protein
MSYLSDPPTEGIRFFRGVIIGASMGAALWAGAILLAMALVRL